jgi:hypothetical protein
MVRTGLEIKGLAVWTLKNPSSVAIDGTNLKTSNPQGSRLTLGLTILLGRMSHLGHFCLHGWKTTVKTYVHMSF